MVTRRGRSWKTRHGPFESGRISRRNATLLVSGVNLHVRAADELLRRFSFVPQARLDDVMVSFATPGGGVGPHVDSYDVFLLQGPGRRRWTWWFSGKKFSAVLEEGDMLYLPPGLRHDGVALDECFTYSIGFRAPRGAELAAAFLDWLHSRGLPDARYRDPGMRPARHAGAIPAAMISFAQRVLSKIRWSRADAARFLGEYLTEPKPHVVFQKKKARKLRANVVARLDARTQLLYAGHSFFMNGEALAVGARQRAPLRELADRRSLRAAAIARAGLAGLIYEWQRHGFVALEHE